MFDSVFNVKIPVFEGPMDLLLYVVQQRRIDYSELPLATIARDFLEYTRSNDKLDLDSAGEYLYIASVLIRMKVKSLLPREEPEEEYVDPEIIAEREEELEEIYREIIAAARKLADGETVQRDHFPRGLAADVEDFDETEEILKDVSLVNLAEAFRDVTIRMEQPKARQLVLFQVTVEQQAALITKVLRENGKLRFRDLVETFNERIEAVMAFLALLDMIRKNHIKVRQRGLFGPIWIYPGDKFKQG